MTVETRTPLSLLVSRLADLQETDMPVLSVYLDASPNERGRPAFGPFLRKELKARGRTWAARSPERESFERDAARIEQFATTEAAASTRGIAIFACSATGLWEVCELERPFPAHRLYVSTRPHLYPLAQMLDQYRRYAVVVADTNAARIFVFGLGGTERKETIQNEKLRRHDMGGWAQMHYQRHVDEHAHWHAKEAAEHLARVVREEGIESVILAGDEVILPLLREQMPAHLNDKVIDLLALDIRTPEHEVLARTLAAFREHDAQDDVLRVQRLLDEYRGGGLAAAGLKEVQSALALGQVDELLIGPPASLSGGEEAADELVAKARQTSARVTFIEEPSLLGEVGGVAAALRFRLTPDGPAVAPLDGEGGEA